MSTNSDTNAEGLQVLLIKGEPASKANSRRLVYTHGKTMFIKSSKALAYAKSFKEQAGNCTPVDGDVCVEIKIWYASRRPDLDESLILDLLQGVAYLNDRQVKEKHIYWGLDKTNPRCEIRVKKILDSPLT